MATNITAVSSFATSNMKPASGEQADALWAQNLADNLGNLYFQEKQLSTDWIKVGFDPNNEYRLYSFRKTSAHNALRFRTRGRSGIVAGAVTDSVEIADTLGGLSIITDTENHTRTAQVIYSWDLDISSLTNGTEYFGFLYVDDVTKAVEGAWVSLVHTVGATI